MTVDEVRELAARLVKRHGSAERVAAVLKGAVSVRAMRRHANGEAMPAPKTVKLYVALDARTTPKARTEAPAPTPSAPVFDRTKPTLDAVIELATRADEVLGQVLGDRDASHRDRSGAIQTCGRVLRELAALRGELEPTEQTILRSAAWARTIGIVVEVLKGYPDAARAVSVAIEALEEGS